MRRLLGIAVLILLVSSYLPPPAFGASAGSKCSVLNKKVNAGAITLICKKNAKGIKVWIKQTSTKLPPVSPSPTPTKTPELWEMTEQILDRAWNTRTKSSTSFTYEFEPGWKVPEGLKTSLTYMEQAADFFAALNIPITSKMLVVVGRFDYAGKRILELGCPRQSPDNVSDNCAPGVIYYNGDSREFPDYQSVLIHEAFHQAQSDAAAAVGRRQFHYPLWLRQGGAEVMRNYVYGKVTGVGYSEMRRRAKIRRDVNCENFRLRANIAQGRLGTTSSTCDYTGGLFTVERLIAQTGSVDALVSFIQRKDVSLDLYDRVLGSGAVIPALTEPSYVAAVEKIYGLPTDTFEKEMEDYVKKELFG